MLWNAKNIAFQSLQISVLFREHTKNCCHFPGLFFFAFPAFCNFFHPLYSSYLFLLVQKKKVENKNLHYSISKERNVFLTIMISYPIVILACCSLAFPVHTASLSILGRIWTTVPHTRSEQSSKASPTRHNSYKERMVEIICILTFGKNICLSRLWSGLWSILNCVSMAQI